MIIIMTFHFVPEDTLGGNGEKKEKKFSPDRMDTKADIAFKHKDRRGLGMASSGRLSSIFLLAHARRDSRADLPSCLPHSSQPREPCGAWAPFRPPSEAKTTGGVPCTPRLAIDSAAA